MRPQQLLVLFILTIIFAITGCASTKTPDTSGWSIDRYFGRGVVALVPSDSLKIPKTIYCRVLESGEMSMSSGRPGHFRNGGPYLSDVSVSKLREAAHTIVFALTGGGYNGDVNIQIDMSTGAPAIATFDLAEAVGDNRWEVFKGQEIGIQNADPTNGEHLYFIKKGEVGWRPYMPEGGVEVAVKGTSQVATDSSKLFEMLKKHRSKS